MVWTKPMVAGIPGLLRTRMSARQWLEFVAASDRSW
jgi:hypothetical protein